MPNCFSRILLLAVTLLATGCHHLDRKGIISTELPLTLDDLGEIKAGEENHERVLENYRVFDSPKLQAYISKIADNIAAVSTRPHLPYKIILLDDEEVNMFGGPGGYIYMTRGLLNFVGTEDEIAALLAHEIGHISHYDYSSIPQHTNMKKLHQYMLKGSELARDSIGTYGTAINYGLKGMEKAAPYVSRRFNADAEIVADDMAIKFMTQAGYDARGLQTFMDRLSKVEMGDVGRFVLFMNAHPPFQDRRMMLDERLAKMTFDEKAVSIEFKADTLAEVRQTSVNAPSSILFVPQLGVHHVTPLALEDLQRKESLQQKADAH
ncbi:MAG TPA: M48 family metalloprotease [Verrucomicrobiae bacterium]|jgi:predicted Zn-dependent protease|nr:M48 family metalloprotease [Verrucomicrobiae bacterium]